jgi:hypothetical protein
LGENEGRRGSCPKDDDAGPIVVRERSQGSDGHKNDGDPFDLDPHKEHFNVGINAGEGDKDAEMQGGGSGYSKPSPKPCQEEKNRRHPQE